MNDFPIVTLSERLGTSFSKMPIKVSTKTRLNTLCVLSIFLSAHAIAQAPHPDADKEATRTEQPKEISKETSKEGSKESTKQGNARSSNGSGGQGSDRTSTHPSAPSSQATHAGEHKANEHKDTKDSRDNKEHKDHKEHKDKANHSKVHSEEHSGSNKRAQSSSPSTAPNLTNITNATNATNATGATNSAPAPTTNPTTTPTTNPTPTATLTSTQTSASSNTHPTVDNKSSGGGNSANSANSANNASVEAKSKSASTRSNPSERATNTPSPSKPSPPPAAPAALTSPAVETPLTPSVANANGVVELSSPRALGLTGTPPTESNNSGTNNASASAGANNSSQSIIGSFIDSLLSFPLINSKSSTAGSNPRADAGGTGTINLGPLPEPVPAPLYLSGSKFSAPLITPYSLSSGERNTTGDNALLDMAQAFKKGDRKRLTSTLPYAAGHPLEPWAAYWELRARLDEASYSEVRDFLKRYAGTYQEDRMRNDWLLMAGSRREWDTLLDEYPYFRMRDDKELQCYYLLAQFVQLGPKAQADTSELVLQNWHALRDADDGCMLAVDRLFDAHKISELDIWRKVRAATEYNQGRLAKNALKIIEPKYLPELEDIFKNPARFLSQPISAPNRPRDELITIALIRLAATDPSDAVRQLLSRWISHLNTEQRTWVWAAAGREAAQRGDPKSLEYFEHASVDKEIGNDELLAWKVRVALRVDVRPRWEMVDQAISAMSSQAQRDPTWVYWRARALLQKKPQTPQITQEAQTLLASIAGVKGFYEQLALEELGKKITSPPRPESLKTQEINSVKANPALRRALYAINLGLRSEGNREWNYATNLVDNAGKLGGMSDRELLAAASYACEQEVWDRCVNSAERSKVVDVSLRFPMPFKDMVLKRTKEISIDPAYVYGLIRQESRFVMDAKSNVGASGLMQIMPKTAAWTAKKIGLLNFKPESLATREVNIAIGTGYLKLVLDSFDGSMPMAAAAYNAGPSRVRRWQEGSVVEGAIWAEFLPFNETRDYVKKVLANTVNYQALITSEPQSLKARMGTIGPMDAAKALLENSDLP